MAAFGNLYHLRRLRRTVSTTVLYGIAALILTGVIAVTIGWGLSTSDWESSGPGAEWTLSFKEDPTASWTLDEALGNLPASAPMVKSFATQRSEHPFWLRITLPEKEQPYSVAFPSRHIRALNCWVSDGLDGASTSSAFSKYNSIRPSRAGYAIDLLTPSAGSLLCKAAFVGPARASIVIADPSTIKVAEHRFERSGGLLFGSLLMLAGFSAVVAAISRDSTFFFFSIWIILNLRIAAVSAGWDFSWLGISPQFELAFRQISIGGYSLISGLLFGSLFKKEIQSRNLNLIYKIAISLACVILLASLILPHKIFLPVMWGTAAFATLLVGVMLTRIFINKPSSIAVWYGLAWAISMTGILGEILRAATNQSFEIPWLNQSTGAVLSSLLTGVALAQRLNSERQQRIAAQNNAVYALQRFRETYNAMPVGLFSMRLDGTIVEYNPAFGMMFNLDPPSQYRQPRRWEEVSSKLAFDTLRVQAEDGRIVDTEIAIASRDGGRRWLHMRSVRKSERFETWVEDITARKEAEGRLQFLADHDSLTGLLNRRGFNAHLERAIAASRTRVVCFAYIDLDRFKLVNDLFGHVAGDQILRQMSTRTREVIRPPHVAARVGGDEFVVIIDGMDLDPARELCEELRRALSDRPYQHQDKAFNVAASVGLIRLSPDMTPRDALTASDRACSEAKRSGGSAVVAFDASSSELTSYLDEIKLVANMRERLPVENFFTQLQPIVSLRNPYSSLCYEVLVRMRDPSGAVVPPGRFIAAAERNGLMSQIDRWVLRSTLEWLDDNPDHRDSIGFCTVNLSGASLNDEKFLQDTIALIRNHSDATRKICFEITESVALYDLNTTRRFVDSVKSFGARVALDDFGAGYTSFSYLKELPGDMVKIDGSFIRDVNLNPANYAITRAVVDLAHEIGMACVAEWAENAEIVQSLIDLNVDYAQGFGLCRPVDPERLLHANDGLALIQDTRVIEILTAQRPPEPRRRASTSRRSILSV